MAKKTMSKTIARNEDGTPVYDGRRYLVVYQTTKGYWKWKLLVNKKVVVRSEGQWIYPVLAKDAFNNLKDGLGGVVLSGIYDEVPDSSDRTFRFIKKRELIK